MRAECKATVIHSLSGATAAKHFSRCLDCCSLQPPPSLIPPTGPFLHSCSVFAGVLPLEEGAAVVRPADIRFCAFELSVLSPIATDRRAPKRTKYVPWSIRDNETERARAAEYPARLTTFGRWQRKALSCSVNKQAVEDRSASKNRLSRRNGDWMSTKVERLLS